MSGFARGADVSWLTEMESSGYKFYTAEEKEQECMSLLRDLGMNAIRLRVWVNPENDTDDVRGWCNKGDVLLKAWRAHNLGYRIMIDFHYSDRWADPSQQAKPQAWADYSVEQLKQAIADHTKDVLSALKEKGIDVEWVQVGNETHQGMLFPTGQTTSEEGRVNFASFVTAGYDAVLLSYPWNPEISRYYYFFYPLHFSSRIPIIQCCSVENHTPYPPASSRLLLSPHR